MIDAHRGAFEYEWRTRFGLPLARIGGRAMRYGEAIRLAQILAADPASRVAASMAEWTHPISREALILADLYDLQHAVAWGQAGGKGSKPKPYPRPWPTRTSKQVRPAAEVTQADILAALRRAGHTASLPGADNETEVISHG